MAIEVNDLTQDEDNDIAALKEGPACSVSANDNDDKANVQPPNLSPAPDRIKIVERWMGLMSFQSIKDNEL